MSDPEVLHTPFDKRGPGAGFPGEGFRTRGRNKPGRATLWNHNPVADFEPEALWGAYPKRFVAWAVRELQVQPHECLHVCSGALTETMVCGAVRVDLRDAARPTVRADGRRLPFRDGSFAAVLIDPPYSVEYAANLYGTDYPRPSHLLREAGRVVRPGGRVGFLHFLCPSNAHTGLELLRIVGVTQGLGYRIRAFTIYRRPGPTLWESA